MSPRAVKPLPDRVAMAAIESDELHQPEIDAFIARNREVLAESLLRSYEEIARGEESTPTIDDIIAEGQKRYRARRQSWALLDQWRARASRSRSTRP